MKLNDLLYRIKAPCPKCPYKLGAVKFTRNPCPECKANNYSVYKQLTSKPYEPVRRGKP